MPPTRIVAPTRSRLSRRFPLASGLLLTLIAVLAPGFAATANAATAPPQPGLQWRATIDGHDVSTANANDPVPLRAGHDAQVALTVTNPGPDTVTIRTLRLEGRVIGMSFFAFSTRIDLAVTAGSTQQRTIQLDLSDLGDQAVGLIPARLSLLKPDRTVIDDRPLATDVRGSLRSAYGIFGLAIAGITLILVVSLAFEVARHQLPPNRWRRAVRFLAPGLGVGLTATFTLSATRILIPSASVWVPLVIGCGLAGFIIGYLTPTPDDEDYQDDYDRADYDGTGNDRYAGSTALGTGDRSRALGERPAQEAQALESDPWPPPRPTP
jgi:hypothetical protein